MSRASNSLKATDVTATPIKLKYSASYSDTTICDSGIYAQTGINGPVTITGSIPEATLRYWSIRHLYYSNFLTGSYQVSGSSADNFLQSTAASGTFEGNTVASASADIRSFPTASGAKIKIINIPRSSFGEQVSKKSFFLTSDDGTSYQLVDDGNGNIIDVLSSNEHVGNIIYAQGFVIITNSNYYCAMDGGPTTFPKSYVFDITTSPKTFTPILGAIPDCAPIVSSSLALQEYPYYSFPSNSISNVGVVTLSESDPLTNKIGTYKSLYTLESTYCATSDEQVIDVQIVDCTVRGLTVIEIAPSPSPTPTPTRTVTPTPTITATPSVTVTPSVSSTLPATPSVTPSVTATPSLTQTPTPSISATASPSMTPTPSISVSPNVVFTYLGRTTPDAANSANACSSYLTVRGYSSLVSSLAAITVGDIFYDSYPGTPTNGGNNWIALKSGGVGDAYAFQINTVGAVIAVGGNCSGGKVFSAWSFVSGNNNYLGTSSSGTIYGWPVGTSGTTIITGTLVVTGTGTQNISVCAAPGGTSATVSVTCDLVPASGTSYSFSATDSTAGSPTCDNQLVAPNTYTVTLRGVFGTNSAGQSVYIN